MTQQFPYTSVTLAYKKGKKDVGNYRAVSLASVPRKVMEQLVLDAISMHLKVIRNSQHGFTKGELSSINLDAF